MTTQDHLDSDSERDEDIGAANVPVSLMSDDTVMADIYEGMRYNIRVFGLDLIRVCASHSRRAAKHADHRRRLEPSRQ